jgi:hypothetical protein
VLGIGINTTIKPPEDGAVSEQMYDSEQNHSLACDRHQDLSADG